MPLFSFFHSMSRGNRAARAQPAAQACPKRFAGGIIGKPTGMCNWRGAGSSAQGAMTPEIDGAARRGLVRSPSHIGLEIQREAPADSGHQLVAHLAVGI